MGLVGSSHLILDRETEVRRLAREGPEAIVRRTKARGKNIDQPQRPSPVPHRSRQGHLNLLIRPKPLAKPIDSPSRGNLLEGGLRSNGMPHKGFADPVTSDETEFRLNMPISELTERVTQPIKASNVNSIPPVVETTDGATVSKMS